MNFDQLIRFAVDQGASDLHLQTAASPLLRINGQIRTLESPPVSGEELAAVHPLDQARAHAEQFDQALVARSRLCPRDRGRRPIPLQRLQPSGYAGDGAARRPAQGPDDRRAESTRPCFTISPFRCAG